MRLHHGLFHILDLGRIRQVAGVIDRKLRSVVLLYFIDNARCSRHKVQVKLALQPFLDDLHVQQPKESAAEAETKRHGGLRFIGKRRIVEDELIQRIAQGFIIRTVRRIDAAEYHRVCLLVARERFLRGVRHIGDGVTHLGFGDAFDGSSNITDLARSKLIRGLQRRREHTHLRNIKLIARCHGADAHASAHRAFLDAHIAQSALVVVINAVKDQRAERLVRPAHRRRHKIHDLREHFVHVRAKLCGDARRVRRRQADHILDFADGMLRIGARQVDFVDDRHDLKAIVQREINIGKRLRLDALRCIHNEHRTFTCCKRTGNFISKVHMARRVDQVEHILLAVRVGVIHPHGCGLDRDAALTLDIHRVKHLRFHIAQGDGIRQFHHAVSKGGLAMVDMCDDAKIPNQILAVCHRIPPSFFYSKSIGSFT